LGDNPELPGTLSVFNMEETLEFLSDFFLNSFPLVEETPLDKPDFFATIFMLELLLL